MLATVPKLSESSAPPRVDGRSAKRKAKVRSAWIAFAGRIVAQILGAAATVGFALVVFNGAPAASGVNPQPPAALAGLPATVAHSRFAVAVLPFHVYTAAAEHAHIGGALTDLLVTELANGGKLSVTSTTSSLRFQAPSATIPEIGRQLGVSHVVEGSISIAGGRARVNAQLIDAASDKHVWARSYEASIDDVLALEAQMAAQIAQEVRGAIGHR